MEDALHNEKKIPRPLTIESLLPAKSKDVITARYDGEWSALRSGHADRPIHCYDVTNVTKSHDYKVEFLENDKGIPHYWCNCIGTGCKHVKTALNDLLTRLPDFGKVIWGEVFQDCKQGAHAECLYKWSERGPSTKALTCACPHHTQPHKKPTIRTAAEAALKILTGSDREYALVIVDRPNYTICDMLREALGMPAQDRSQWKDEAWDKRL